MVIDFTLHVVFIINYIIKALMKKYYFFENKYAPIFLYVILITIISIPYWFNIGYISQMSGDSKMKTLVKVYLSSTISATIVFFISTFLSYRLSVIYSVLMSILWVVITYFYMTFGDIDHSIIASIIETTPSEATGYLSHLNPSPLLLLSVPMVYFLIKINTIRNNKTNFLLALLLLFSLALYAFPEVKRAYYTKSFNVKSLVVSLYSRINTIKIVNDIITTIELKGIENMPVEPEWSNVSVSDSTYDFNYVVIVGESAPRKYFSYYRDVDVSKYKGWEFISNPISPATNTRESIPRILSINERDDINLNLNVIDLANHAGLSTFWFSNQGFIGVHDTPITVLAKRASNTKFHNKGSFATAGSDDRLLVDLKDAVADGKTGKLIFLHTLGSHSPFCERSKYYSSHIDNLDEKNEISCFEDAIYNTERYIEKVESIMKRSNSNYKVIYFSDHGLTDVDYSPYKVHGGGSLFTFDAINVPLIFIDSTSEEEGKMIDSTYYLRDFPHTFSDWTGIKSDQIDIELSVYNEDIYQTPYTYQGSRFRKL